MTHPFHPLFGQEFILVESRWTWGEERVVFLDQQGELGRMPIAWTDLSGPDPFLIASDGRAFFRTEDLLRLADLIDRLSENNDGL